MNRTWQEVKNMYHLAKAILANAVYGFPSKKLKVIAITGTDGKTTTATLLYHILQSADKKVALISTVAAYIGNEEIDTGFHVTTPSSFALQKLLKKIVDEGCEYVVMEVTSHGIDQNRVWGIEPLHAGITNVSHEHLDYHKTYDNYLRTKAEILLVSQHAFINSADSLSYEKLQKILESNAKDYTSYSLTRLAGVIGKAARKRFPSQVYNHQNVALAASIARHIGISPKTIMQAVENFPGVVGRMQHIQNRLGLHIIVDFAHTPNALEQALKAVKQQYKGRVGVVFGCAGERDVSKRPLMGEIATRLADYVVLTAEDPRKEDVWSIINQIKSGITSGHNKVVSIPDRKDAITFAIAKLAKKGDTVLITGKGHEKSMCFGTIEYPWSDPGTVREVLASLEEKSI